MLLQLRPSGTTLIQNIAENESLRKIEQNFKKLCEDLPFASNSSRNINSDHFIENLCDLAENLTLE